MLSGYVIARSYETKMVAGLGAMAFMGKRYRRL